MKKLLISFFLLLVVSYIQGCMDRSRHCARYKKLNYCNKARNWMRRYCLKTCGLCGKTEPPIPTENPITRTPPITLEPHKGGCGNPFFQAGRVIGGTTSKKGSWPWQVLMKYKGRGGCGGSLISSTWVVTAAHCVMYKKASKIRVVLGDHDTSVKEGTEQVIRVSKFISHPKWNAGTMDNDIALLKLAKPATLNQYVRTACLPSSEAPIDQECFITGWGKTRHPGSMTNIIQQGEMKIVSNLDCYKLNSKEIPIRITHGMVCAGSGGSTRTSGCHGDSGGPLVCKKGNIWELHGAVSHGSKDCNSKKTYTVFARIHHYRQWIKHHTGL